MCGVPPRAKKLYMTSRAPVLILNLTRERVVCERGFVANRALPRMRGLLGRSHLPQGEGILHGVPTAFYDLFRVENDKLAEHWDIVFAEPDTLPHGNGLF